MEVFDYEELVKATDNFSPSNLIGRGSHGSVYKVTSLATKGPQTTTFAVKKLSHSHEPNSINEISILSSLSPSPNIVNLIGSTRHPDTDPLLVMEFMPNGSLHDSLHDSSDPPSWPTRFRAALQVARALESLHGLRPHVIHRDVKSANVLFDAEWNAKLGDFGLSVAGDCSPSPAGTIGYIDPSYTCPSNLSPKNDVYSFGVLALEILSGRKAIDVSKDPSSVVDWANSLVEKRQIALIPDLRVPLPAASEGDFRRLLRVATRCLSPDKFSRPSAREIVNELEGIKLAAVKETRMLPTWMSPLRSIMMLPGRQRRKSDEKKSRRDHGRDAVAGVGRLMSLREVLADITLEENKQSLYEV